MKYLCKHIYCDSLWKSNWIAVETMFILLYNLIPNINKNITYIFNLKYEPFIWKINTREYFSIQVKKYGTC